MTVRQSLIRPANPLGRPGFRRLRCSASTRGNRFEGGSHYQLRRHRLQPRPVGVRSARRQGPLLSGSERAPRRLPRDAPINLSGLISNSPAAIWDAQKVRARRTISVVGGELQPPASRDDPPGCGRLPPQRTPLRVVRPGALGLPRYGRVPGPGGHRFNEPQSRHRGQDNPAGPAGRATSRHRFGTSGGS